MNTQSAPTVQQGVLHGMLDTTGLPSHIAVDSEQWFAWLEAHISFRYESPAGSFSARKEVRSGNTYWYAYRKKQGKRVSTYIGRSEDVTGACLSTVVGRLLRLEERAAGDGAPASETAPLPPSGLAGAKPMAASAATTGRAAQAARHTDALLRLSPPPPVSLPSTPLVDRVSELATILALLSRPDVRVVSLTGAGGIGKTRLALEAISVVRDAFRDGVYFLTVDSVRDPLAVLTRMAQLLGLSPDGHGSVVALLHDALQHRELLLIVDNLEQVPEVVPLLDDLVKSCCGLKLMVTTREVLHLIGEQHILVRPLRFPDPTSLPNSEDLLSYPAVELFVRRATAIAPDLAVSGAPIDAIARICARLDGLPLAIELAAARVRLLSPEALLERLDRRLAVLTGGGRERPPRHQTLRATLDWSYDLLSQDEQMVLRRLAVFSGGCVAEAAEAVCGAFNDLSTPVLDVLSSLIDKSLLLSVTPAPATETGATQGGGAGIAATGPRLSLPETVREYALERLEESGELRAARDAHASHYISLAQRAGPGLYREHQLEWLARLDQAELNFSAALSFLLSERDYGRSATLVGELGRFWFLRGRLSEGLGWAEQVLYGPAADHAPVASNGHGTASKLPARNRQTLFAAGLLAMHLDQGERAQDWLRESFDLSREAGDVPGLARAAHVLTLCYLLKGNLTAAQALAGELAACAGSGAGPWPMAAVDYTYGVLTQYCGEPARARSYLERSAALFAEAGDTHLSRLAMLNLADAFLALGERTKSQMLFDEQIKEMDSYRWGWTAGYMLCAHGRFAMSAGDWARARVILEKALRLFDRLQDVRGIARATLFLAQAALYQQDYTTAITMARRCLANARMVGAQPTIIGCLEELADVAIRRGKVAWAVQLWAAGERQRQVTAPHHCPAPPAERAQLVAAARERLGERDFLATWEEGRDLPLEELLSVENVASSMNKHSSKEPERPAGLTRRELDVLMLLARGLSNVEIARELVISPTTVVSYLNVIYRKLDVSSRTAAMRYVIDHNLVPLPAGAGGIAISDVQSG